MEFNVLTTISQTPKQLTYCRHGDRFQASAPQCWHSEVKWDCTLTSASFPIVKHDQHVLTVDRVYRKGRLLFTLLLETKFISKCDSVRVSEC